jgi:hypothetical protein
MPWSSTFCSFSIAVTGRMFGLTGMTWTYYRKVGNFIIVPVFFYSTNSLSIAINLRNQYGLVCMGGGVKGCSRLPYATDAKLSKLRDQGALCQNVWSSHKEHPKERLHFPSAYVRESTNFKRQKALQYDLRDTTAISQKIKRRCSVVNILKLKRAWDFLSLRFFQPKLIKVAPIKILKMF